jgi:hypothetical protein
LKHPSARIRVRLLGPCFKTGESGPFCRRPQRTELVFSLFQMNLKELPCTIRLSKKTSKPRNERIPAEACVWIETLFRL